MTGKVMKNFVQDKGSKIKNIFFEDDHHETPYQKDIYEEVPLIKFLASLLKIFRVSSNKLIQECFNASIFPMIS